jgi:hypothetical protein
MKRIPHIFITVSKREHGIHFDIKKYKRNIRIMAIVLFVEITIASIGLPGAIIFGEIPAESLYGMILWPMHTASGSLLIIAGVSYAVVSLFALTSCLSMVMFYLFVLACIKKELQYISDDNPCNIQQMIGIPMA